MSGTAESQPGTEPQVEAGDEELDQPSSTQPSKPSSDDAPDTSSRLWPRSVRLNSRRWAICYVDKEHPEMEYSEIDENWNLGACNIPRRTIYIEKSQGRDSMVDTLVHEMAHACFSTAPAPVPHKDNDEVEEQCVLWFTETFFEIINNAPWFWEDDE